MDKKLLKKVAVESVVSGLISEPIIHAFMPPGARFLAKVLVRMGAGIVGDMAGDVAVKTEDETEETEN